MRTGIAPPARIALVALLCWIAGGDTSRAAVTQPNSADRFIMWTGCSDLASLSDSELDSWKSRGVDGFACGIGWLRGMGGTQDFTGDPKASLTGSNYELQRRLRDSKVVRRLRARGMKAYLGAYLVNYFNTATPLKEWFDDAGWSGQVLPKMSGLAGAARHLGFAGLTFDQELYTQTGGATTATWSWSYPGRSRPEHQVRAKARQRGRELMGRLLARFPGIELLAYDVQFPETWGEVVQEEVNGLTNVYGSRLDIDFWDGLSSVAGYGAIRLADAYFYKVPHLGTWETAFQYHFNKLYAYLSRRLSNWDYASSRFHVSPFAWIDEGPSSSFEAARPPDYVASQLQAFRKWGMGREFANYAYAPLREFDYTPYVSAMRAASTPAVVDAQPPSLMLNAPPTGSARPVPSLAVGGIVGDNLAIRAVRWANECGGTGTARLTWEPLAGDYRTGHVWRTRCSVPRIPLRPGPNRITIAAEDIKGLATARTITFANGPYPYPCGCLPRALSVGRRGLGRIRLRNRSATVLRRLGSPRRRRRGVWHYCVIGRGKVIVVFSRRKRALFVASTARGHRRGRVSPGTSFRRLRRAYRGRRLRRIGRGLYRSGPLVFGVRRRRVRYVAVAARPLRRSRRLLLRYHRRAGFGKRARR